MGGIPEKKNEDIYRKKRKDSKEHRSRHARIRPNKGKRKAGSKTARTVNLPYSSKERMKRKKGIEGLGDDVRVGRKEKGYSRRKGPEEEQKAEHRGNLNLQTVGHGKIATTFWGGATWRRKMEDGAGNRGEDRGSMMRGESFIALIGQG